MMPTDTLMAENLRRGGIRPPDGLETYVEREHLAGVAWLLADCRRGHGARRCRSVRAFAERLRRAGAVGSREPEGSRVRGRPADEPDFIRRH